MFRYIKHINSNKLYLACLFNGPIIFRYFIILRQSAFDLQDNMTFMTSKAIKPKSSMMGKRYCSINMDRKRKWFKIIIMKEKNPQWYKCARETAIYVCW